MEQQVKELQELKALAAELAGEIENLEGQIKDYMDSRHLDTLEGEGYRVTWKEITSLRFDTTAFKARYPLFYKDYSRATTTRRFTVTA